MEKASNHAGLEPNYRAMTIQEYADHCGVSTQAIYKRIRSKGNSKMLCNKIINTTRGRILTAEAVEYLEHTRTTGAALALDAKAEAYKVLTAANGNLERENRAMSEKIIDLLENLRIAENAAAMRIVDIERLNGQIRALTISAEQTATELQKAAETADRERERADKATERAIKAESQVDQATERAIKAESQADQERERADNAVAELEKLKKRGFWKKVMDLFS